MMLMLTMIRMIREAMKIIMIFDHDHGDVEDRNFGNHEVRVDVSDDAGGGGGVTFDEVPRLHHPPTSTSQTPIFDKDIQKLTYMS